MSALLAPSATRLSTSCSRSVSPPGNWLSAAAAGDVVRVRTREATPAPNTAPPPATVRTARAISSPVALFRT
jgi:hypothetical protein